MPGRVLVVRTADGRYAKVSIQSYYKGAPASPTQASESGYYTFRYVFQPAEVGWGGARHMIDEGALAQALAQISHALGDRGIVGPQKKKPPEGGLLGGAISPGRRTNGSGGNPL